MSQLLGADYAPNHMSYDLGRLRLNGLIERLDASNTYVLTADGQRVASFYSNLHQRLLRSLLAADIPPAPVPLRQALATIEQHVEDCINRARLRNAAGKLKINVKSPAT